MCLIELEGSGAKFVEGDGREEDLFTRFERLVSAVACEKDIQFTQQQKRLRLRYLVMEFGFVNIPQVTKIQILRLPHTYTHIGC